MDQNQDQQESHQQEHQGPAPEMQSEHRPMEERSFQEYYEMAATQATLEQHESASNTQATKEQIAEKINKKSALQILLEWTAPERIWHPKDRKWYLISAFVILMVIFFAVRIENYIMIMAMVLFAGLWFLQGYMEPLELDHKIMNRGIFTHGKMRRWEEMRHFWIAEKDDELLLHIDFPKEIEIPRLTLLLPQELEFDLFNILIDYIPYANPEEAEYYFFTKLIYGEYQKLNKYVPDLDAQLAKEVSSGHIPKPEELNIPLTQDSIE